MTIVRSLWLRAQGVPRNLILMNNWRNNTYFEGRPEHCVVCDRPWRPDKPEYIPVYGVTRDAQVLEFTEWHSPHLDVVALTGLAPGQMQIRYICTEHRDRWESVPNCLTGQMDEMRDPPSKLERDWATARYWTKTVFRFIGLLAQYPVERVYLWFKLRQLSPKKNSPSSGEQSRSCTR